MTVKVVKKKQKHKVKGAVRFVNKTVQNVSFFHFFSPPAGMFELKLNKYSMSLLKIIGFVTIKNEMYRFLKNNP